MNRAAHGDEGRRPSFHHFAWARERSFAAGSAGVGQGMTHQPRELIRTPSTSPKLYAGDGSTRSGGRVAELHGAGHLAAFAVDADVQQEGAVKDSDKVDVEQPSPIYPEALKTRSSCRRHRNAICRCRVCLLVRLIVVACKATLAANIDATRVCSCAVSNRQDGPTALPRSAQQQTPLCRGCSKRRVLQLDGSRRNAAPACEKRQSAVRSRLMVNSTRPLGSSRQCSTSLM
jgi:hypothetical protein